MNTAIRKIFLTQDKFALVDAADFEWLSAWKWCAHYERGRWYAVRSARKPDGTKTIVRMHRAILGQPEAGVDHENGDGLDNRRQNLRPANKSENAANSRPSKRNTTGVKGTCFDKARKKFMAYITVRGRRKALGRFESLAEAASVYAEEAKKQFGQFARTN